MKKNIFLIFVLFIVACNKKKATDVAQICMIKGKPKVSIPLIHSNISTAKSIADQRTVTLKLNKFTSSDYPEAEKVADSALHIASVLLSSQDFKNTMAKLDFTCANYSVYCHSNCKRCNDRFSGSVVLDSVFRQRNVNIDLYLDSCTDEYGHSTRNVLEIYSCKQIVFPDEKKLSPAYCYAYHIAHEYMHIVGYFHTDWVDDVAEKTGWIGWEILLDWRQNNQNIMKLQPGQI